MEPAIPEGDGITSTCQEDSEWSPLSLSCLPGPCGPAPYVDNGNVTYAFSAMVFTAHYICNAGYVFENRKFIALQLSVNFLYIYIYIYP